METAVPTRLPALPLPSPLTEHYNRLLDKIKTMRPMLLIRKGKRFAIVPSGSSEADKAIRDQILSRF